MWFSPKWKKEARLLAKGALKFLNYKRDLLKQDRIEEIESRRRDLLVAVSEGNEAKAAEASKQLRGTCENSLRVKPQSWLEENVEVMFVALVIALGLRTYVLQPFRIPTGSMQPTLNGIIGTPWPESEWPSFAERMWDGVMRGRTYVKVVNDRERRLVGMNDTQWLMYLSRSELRFDDGSTLRLPAPLSPCNEIGLQQALMNARMNGGVIPAGAVLCEGTIDAGDLVPVDRISYHFRKPKRGEVWVFDTRGIEGTKKPQSEADKRNGISNQQDGTHYIKRLAGVPGDTISISPPHLIVNGKVATEPGFEKVYQYPLYNQPGKFGYSLAQRAHGNGLLFSEDDKLVLKKDAPPGMREYASLGDNSGNSLDSRYWGSVKEFNAVGPALFSLWPITTGHWGFIR